MKSQTFETITSELANVTGGGKAKRLAKQFGFNLKELKAGLTPKIAKMAIKADLLGVSKLK